MGRIRILSDNVANKIAAGEVVERPASVVKEILENSLDAGAANIRIEAEGGGRRLIRIADDGCGMIRDDAMLAFERHATSKVSDIKDLVRIATLGFRGEALPSIASVSRLVLETRPREEEVGTRVELAGGKLLRCEEKAMAPGTVITVRDLFFNVPARKKFLRTENTELAHIAGLATHYSLAHPDKSFQLIHSGKELLNVSPVSTLGERAFQVLGARTFEELMDLGDRDTELILPAAYPRPPSESDPEPPEPERRLFRLRGFISRPQVQKLNRNSIYLFVNGRLIRDRLLLHALTSAYHNLMPPACFPVALLFLECDPLEVDVNVHPSKTEIRFRHAQFAHDFLRDTLRRTLTESRPAPQVSLAPDTGQEATRLPYSEYSQSVDNLRWEEAMRGAPRTWGDPASSSPVQTGPGSGFGENTLEEDLPEIALRSAAGPAPRFGFEGDGLSLGREPETVKLRVPDTHGGFPDAAVGEPAATMTEIGDLRPLGQLQDSFIIAAGRDGLWIVDQHVAHERILFEKILRQRSAGAVERQQLLMPLVIELTPAQEIEYARIADELNRTGFETEPFGNRTIAIKAAPAGLAAGDIEKAICEILDIAENELRKVTVEDLRRGIAASIACRAAIKINTPLDERKMEWLLRQLAATEFPMACPHGRPVVLRFGLREILKQFHRI